jgi:O-antigen/teichoic acid export membrane protein
MPKLFRLLQGSGASSVRQLLRSVLELKRSLFGASLLMIQPLFLSLFWVPATSFIIAKLGAATYGQWALALSLNTTALIITNLGLRSFFVRQLAQDPGCAATAFRDQLGTRSLLAVVAAGASIGTAWVLGYPKAVLLATSLLSIGILFNAITACVADLLQALERLPVLASINMVAGLLLLAASVVVTYAELGVPALCAAYLIGPILSGSLSLLFVKRQLFPVSFHLSVRRSIELLWEARVMGSQVFVGTLANQAENLLVPMVSGMTNYGQFAAGSLLVRRLDVLPDALCTAFYPLMVRAYQRQGPGSSLRLLALLPVMFCVPAALCVFCLAAPISRMLFPDNPVVSTFVIQVTVWWVPLVGLTLGLGYALNSAQRERRDTALLMITIILSLLCAPMLIWLFGVLGACLSLLLRQGLSAIVRLSLFCTTAMRHQDGTGGGVGAPGMRATSAVTPPL